MNRLENNSYYVIFGVFIVLLVLISDPTIIEGRELKDVLGFGLIAITLIYGFDRLSRSR